MIVDDDASVRKSLARLLRVHGYETETYASADEYLAQAQDIQAACMILDLEMPGTDGMELQQRLIASGADTAIVFLTGHGDIPTSVGAMKLGAVDFLTKPVDEDTLTEAIANAIIKLSEIQSQRRLTDSVQERIATLTRREREVMQEIMTGAMNKQIAAHLGISEKRSRYIVHTSWRKCRPDRQPGWSSCARTLASCQAPLQITRIGNNSQAPSRSYAFSLIGQDGCLR